MTVINKLTLASVLTFGFLLSMLGFFVILAALFTGVIGLALGIVLIVLINIVVFFISPIIMDLSLRFLYSAREMKLDEFVKTYGAPAEVIMRIKEEKKYVNVKNVYVIDDNTPAAFTYGSLPSEARLALSRGLIDMLSKDELEIVLAHEMGHIANLDFMIMTLAQTFVQIFYMIYSSILKSAMRPRGNSRERKDGSAVFLLLIAVLAYAFYLISRYVVLYLSRVREYYADEFAVRFTKKPKALAMSLIKIAYGLGIAPSEQWAKFKGVEALCIAAPAPFAVKPSNDPDEFVKYTDFDFKSPWATLVELDSTHPLIGRRVKRIYELGMEMGLIKSLPVDLKNAEEERVKPDYLRLGLYLLSMPIFVLSVYIVSFAIGLVGVLIFGAPGISLSLALLIGAVGLSIVASGLLGIMRYLDSRQYTLENLLMDETASPVSGKFVEIEGKAIGRGEAGYVFSTDLYVNTKENVFLLVKTGFAIPVLNFIVGIIRIFGMGQLLGQNVKIKGWFFRGNGYWINGDHIEFSGGTKWDNYMKLGSILGGILYILIGGLVMLFALFSPFLIFML